MKLFLLTSTILVIVAIQQAQCAKKPKDDEEDSGGGGGKQDFQSMFKKFFSKGKDSGKAFQDFLMESGKKMGMKGPKMPGGGGGGEEEESSDKGSEDKGGKAKKNEEVPLAGKVFAFYGKTYGCTNSKVYEEFIKSYKDGKLPTPPKMEDEERDDEWLKKLAKKDVDVNEDSKPSVEDAEGRLKKLEKGQKKTLDDGESQMPPEAQLFLKFVKANGCQDKFVTEYKKYNALMQKEIDKNKDKKKPPPPSFYVSKAETILVEQAEEFQKGAEKD